MRDDHNDDGRVETGICTRRDVVKSGSAAVTFGMLASAFGAALPEHVRAADSATGTTCLTILYPAGPDITFNADYYRDHHLVTIMKLYGSSIERFELRTVAPPPAPPAGAAPGGAPPPPRFSAAVNIWVADLDAFNANNQKHGKTLADDVPHFTNGQPTIQYDKVEGMMGAPRSAAKVGDTCLTILYPNSEGVRWDV